MSLRAIFAKGVKSAFTALGNIPEACTYRRTSSTYNPATGSNVITNSDTAITKGVFVKYDGFEVDRVTILASDVKFLVQKSELSTIVPNLATDKLVRTSESKTYNIIRYSIDPSGSVITLQLRSPS